MELASCEEMRRFLVMYLECVDVKANFNLATAPNAVCQVLRKSRNMNRNMGNVLLNVSFSR